MGSFVNGGSVGGCFGMINPKPLKMANVISTFRNNLAAIRGPPGRLDTKHFNNIPGDRGPNLNSMTMVEKTTVGTCITVSASMEDVVMALEGRLGVSMEVSPSNLGEVADVTVLFRTLLVRMV